MWKKSFSKIYTNVKREDVWKTWTDINNWPSWHGKLDSCKIEGEFKVGNYFMLQPKGMNPVKILITEVNEGFRFSDRTDFFGAQMHDTHILEETPDGLKITNVVTVTGFLRWLWIKLVAQEVANSSESKIDALVKLTKNKYV